MNIQFPNCIKLLSSWREASEPVIENDLCRWKVFAETTKKLKPVAYAEWGYLDFPQAGEFSALLTKLYKNHDHLEYAKLNDALKKQITQHSLTVEEIIKLLVESGWLIRWVRLKADGLSPMHTRFYPGNKLTQTLDSVKKSTIDHARQWINTLTDKLYSINTAGNHLLSENLEQRMIVENFKNVTGSLLTKAVQFLDGISLEPPVLPNHERNAFNPENLTNLFGMTLEFWAALAHAITVSPTGFDWKEIGAQYYQVIGGSKVFDRYRDKLVLITEKTFDISLSEIGLISHGSLYSIYLAGNLAFSTLQTSGINALTNIQVEEMTTFAVPVSQIILTENRALLLKMYKSGWLNKRSDVLVFGVDGRLRKAHKKLLTLMTKTNSALKIFAWVDTDNAGIEIASALAELFPEVRMVMPPTVGYKKTTLPYLEWVKWFSENLSFQNSEQEEYLGDESLWDRIWPIHPDPESPGTLPE